MASLSTDYHDLFTNYSNEDIIHRDFTLSVEEQMAYIGRYMSRHFFDEDHHLVLRKYFANVIDASYLAGGFRDTYLEDRIKIQNMLGFEVFIPSRHFRRIFAAASTYDFPTLKYDADGIYTPQILNYAKFNHFAISIGEGRDVTYEPIIPDSIREVRDYELERAIIGHSISAVDIDLSPNSDAPWNTNTCAIYPQVVKEFPVVYDTLYYTDYLLKYIGRIFTQMLIFHWRDANLYMRNYMIGREMANCHKISNISSQTWFKPLMNLIGDFMTRNGLYERQAELRESHNACKEAEAIVSREQVKFIVNVGYENVQYSINQENATQMQVQIHPLQMNFKMTYIIGEEHKAIPPHYQCLKQFMDDCYTDIKRIFPIFERLENIYRMCALVNLMGELKTRGNIPHDFAIERGTYSRIPANVHVDNIMFFGGITLAPKNYQRIPFIPPPVRTIAPTPSQAPKVDRLYVVRRGLADAPVKYGPVGHSGVLLHTANNEYYLLEYGVGPNKSVAMRKVEGDLATAAEFAENGSQWSKQQHGTAIDQNLTPDAMKQMMENITSKNEYDIRSWNCHMGQENLRRALGLSVEDPYKP